MYVYTYVYVYVYMYVYIIGVAEKGWCHVHRSIVEPS